MISIPGSFLCQEFEQLFLLRSCGLPDRLSSSTTTLWPSTAPFLAALGIKNITCNFFVIRNHKAKNFCFAYTYLQFAGYLVLRFLQWFLHDEHLMILMTLLQAQYPPCIALFVSVGGINTSPASFSSGTTNANPFACPLTFPLTKFEQFLQPVAIVSCSDN